MNMDVMFSSKTDQWSTPQDFYDSLDREFSFTLDPCADDLNHNGGLQNTVSPPQSCISPSISFAK